MVVPQQLAQQIRFLSEKDKVLLLRPHNVSEELLGGDIDFLSSRDSRFGMAIEESFGEPLVKVERQYVHQRYYDWGQVDVLPCLVWDGHAYADEERVLHEARVDRDGFRRPRPGDDAVISWLTSLLWGGFFKEKYVGVIEMGAREDGEAMKDALEWALGGEWAERMMDWVGKRRCGKSGDYVREIRRALVVRAWSREPVETFSRVMFHWGREVVLHFKPPMLLMAFLGPDGSGKSTVLSGVKAALKERRVSTVDLHWRPGVLMKGEEPEGGIVTDPHGKPPRGKIASILKLGLLVADWQLGYWLRLRHALAKASMVISDRFYDDLLIDPKRYRYGGSRGIARLFFQFAPKPDLVFVLTAPADIIYARKQEVAFKVLEEQIKDYEAYAISRSGDGEKKEKFLIRVDRSVDEIVKDIMTFIEQRQHKQTK